MKYATLSAGIMGLVFAGLCLLALEVTGARTFAVIAAMNGLWAVVNLTLARFWWTR